MKIGEHKLTPAGEQVERALAAGYTTAACNFYLFNTREDVPMVEGDQPMSVSVCPEWHRRITKAIGFHDAPVEGEEEANEEADRLGLTGGEREDFVAGFIEQVEGTAPSLIERTVRGPSGLIVGTELVVNPDVDDEAGT